ncbi:MAG: membrane protein insertion efficiency factor YidD [Clostridia bacterium]|nr:membrane protein insertion efficiency factor YidD [Clostridia bacterium]
MKYVAIFFIRLYRKWISPLKPPCCRFTPTCSAYALEAYSKRGFFAGFILSFWRVLRCNPFAKPGYDPVPEKGFKRVPIRSRENPPQSASADTGVASTETDAVDNKINEV